MRRSVDPQMRRQVFQIAGNPVAVGGKYRRDLYPSRILSQLLVDCLEPAFRRQAGNAVQFHGDHTVRSRRQIVIDLPVDKSEQHDDENREHG